MFNKILLYALLAVIGVIGTVATIQYFKIAKLEVNIVQQENAIQAYEELIKVIPFNRMVEERIGDANEEINATLSNSNNVLDGTYRL